MNAYLKCPLFAGHPIAHGFGLRTPLSQPEGFDFLTGPVVAVKQVHGREIVTVISPPPTRDPIFWLGDADALVTAVPGVALGVRTADCAPILLFDPVARVVAAVHAGWRGAAQEIVRHTVVRMEREWGSRPIDLRAAIGPCISPARFEVGAEVRTAFAGYPERLCPSPAKEGQEKWLLDLPGVLLDQFRALGVPGNQVEWIGACTVGDAGRFSSYRREREASTRQWNIIQLRAMRSV